MTIKEQLIRDEGKNRKMYQDAVGVWTIGVGHNLEAKGLSDRAIDVILEDDIADAKADLASAMSWATQLSEPRLGVLINMSFNLGIVGLLGFKNMLKAIRESRWEDAAAAMLDSVYATQVGARAQRLAKQLITNEWQ